MMTKTNPYSILITDDDRGSRETLQEIMQGQGYRTAHVAARALARA